MMLPETYTQRRDEIETYFDRTAVDAWAKLTSDAPVSRIRATVRAGRDKMRDTLLGYLPSDLRGARVLDAGCGTGALAAEVAMRGADVLAIDISPRLIALAEERIRLPPGAGSIEFRVSDMVARDLGQFDWVVAMDSLIHYPPDDMADMVLALSARARCGLAFTFAPRTPALSVMHAVGRLFPRGNRAPDIVPVAPMALATTLARRGLESDFVLARSTRVDVGFYTSQTVELVRR
jgi:magnesium-protoporphyrin O-methyltransferase